MASHRYKQDFEKVFPVNDPLHIKKEFAMPITITAAKPKFPQKAVARARAEASKHRLFFEGNEYAGRGKGYGFDVGYTTTPTHITFTVHKKPFIVKESYVINEFNKFWADFLKEERP